jgi:ssDNA-binding Zn-finger/Zn-ribbon topoisomerase 1
MEHLRIYTNKGNITGVEVTAKGIELLEHLFKVEKIDREEGSGPPCPKCEKGMTERSGARGAFWGCVDFPDCRGTREIDDLEF